MSESNCRHVFEVIERCSETGARRGRLTTPHGVIDTPVFMPVGTQGSVKTISSEELEGLGYRMILGNTYHLHLRPGEQRIRKLGGLHRFMNWSHGILTDSGGFQVFSLRDITRITEEGVAFRSYLDGRKIDLTPERAVEIQLDLGSDIVMAFDECIPYPAEESYVREATRRSFRWTERSSKAFRAQVDDGRLFFGIIQGGMIPHLRDESMAAVHGLEPDGLAIGGLSVGEPKSMFRDILAHTAPQLDPSRPRYLMGVGTPLDIIEAVIAGVDMFDCVIPTRLGRHAHVYTWERKLNLVNARFKEDLNPIDVTCRCSTCEGYSRAYLHHLFRAGEPLGPRLASYHNLSHFQDLIVRIRAGISEGNLLSLAAAIRNVTLEKL